MSMEIEITPKKGFLYIQLTGQFSLPDAKEFSVRMLEVVAEHESHRILVDCTNLQGSLSTMDRYEYSKFAAQQLQSLYSRGVSPAIRFAYVATPPVSDPERFGETVAVNRGVNVRVFDRMEDAVQWLEIDSANKSLQQTKSNGNS